MIIIIIMYVVIYLICCIFLGCCDVKGFLGFRFGRSMKYCGTEVNVTLTCVGEHCIWLIVV